MFLTGLHYLQLGEGSLKFGQITPKPDPMK